MFIRGSTGVLEKPLSYDPVDSLSYPVPGKTQHHLKTDSTSYSREMKGCHGYLYRLIPAVFFLTAGQEGSP
jgi:hypothetical protein